MKDYPVSAAERKKDIVLHGGLGETAHRPAKRRIAKTAAAQKREDDG